MQEENPIDKRTSDSSLEYLKGCPACERTDPELERELQAFAQLLFDVHLAKHGAKRPLDPDADIDFHRGLPRLE